MNVQSRVPALTELSVEGATRWFAKMQQRGLLFHPDDDPAEIESIADGVPTSNTRGIAEARFFVGEMFVSMGDNAYEAASPAFLETFGIRLDA